MKDKRCRHPRSVATQPGRPEWHKLYDKLPSVTQPAISVSQPTASASAKNSKFLRSPCERFFQLVSQRFNKTSRQAARNRRSRAWRCWYIELRFIDAHPNEAFDLSYIYNITIITQVERTRLNWDKSCLNTLPSQIIAIVWIFLCTLRTLSYTVYGIYRLALKTIKNLPLNFFFYGRLVMKYVTNLIPIYIIIF